MPKLVFKFYEMDPWLLTIVQRFIHCFQANKMLQDSIIVFTTDNGGPANGFNANSASNWPLRGVSLFLNQP